MREAVLESLNDQHSLENESETERYERVAKAIRFIRENRLEQPELSDVARAVGLSPHHFQRIFTNWVGVSPKRFLAYLTQSHARQMLAQNTDVLNTALEVGLSGPGRLHDLCVNIEAATPGEIKSGGAGMKIYTGSHPSPFGEMLIHINERGICGISFTDQEEKSMREQRLHNQWPNAEFIVDQKRTGKIAKHIFNQTDNSAPIDIFVKGTNFQVQVWQALVRLKPGTLATYGQIAKAIGKPKASRAVGSAIGANHIGLLIPCHRVIREGGLIGNYHWGIDRKLAMIGWEQAKLEA
ncbi:MAG: methylated-DNA--[protein]-cysteine S-methyltransferase [Rhodospirillaceae bacterium]|nr:methylated-DNA--[protein]-cysteine S-methyltransferase [Nitrosopumilus sp.]MDH5772886.1 methylated-DNA--[protein]-cysteine S-methyltransferase [Rhodospirillaceae bacterium]